MRCWTALELIEIGERGASLGPAARAVLLLEAGGMARDAAEALPLGARDRALFRLRAIQFGETMQVAQRCPECGENYDFTVTAADLGRDVSQEPRTGCIIETAAGPVAIRPITAADLIVCERESSAAQAQGVLRARVAPEGAKVEDATLDEALESLDRDAEVVIAARCPECLRTQKVEFDVAAFFWAEVVLRTPRLMQQVADLARINHWSERDILALPAARRRFYLLAAGA